MAAYRRFVAYVYEYRKEKKGVNCGFVRIEAWRNVCRIELHLLCPGLVSGSECSVYGFVRKDESINGILLGVCETAKEEINCILESSVEHMGDSEHSLEEMGGMIITTDQGGFFGTEWDDMPIRPEKFRVVPRIQEDTSESAAADGKAETDEMVKPGKDEENSRTESKEDKEHPKKDKSAAEIADTEMQKAEAAQTEVKTPESQELHTQSVTEPDSTLVQNSETVSPDQEVMNVQEKKSPDRKPQERKSQNYRRCGTPCEVFQDGELHDCHKISPQDLCSMGRRTCLLRNNRFVQYGYYHFGHLLLCQNHCGQPVLGVPGRYDQQERFMANMFGFPYFKESSEIQVPGGKGGYWYRLIDSTNPNNGNGC